MYIGGIPVIRESVPSISRWLTDLLDMFEENGRSWAYHSDGGWEGWNIIFADDAVIPTSDPLLKSGGDTRNDRFRTVAGYRKRNARQSLIESSRNDVVHTRGDHDEERSPPRSPRMLNQPPATSSRC